MKFRRRLSANAPYLVVLLAFVAALSLATRSYSFSLFQSAETDLKRLPLLKYVVELVGKNYVEPGRIVPGEMFVSALKSLQDAIPEVRVVEPDANHVILMVDNSKRLKLSTQMVNTYSLAPALSKAILFVKKHKVSEIKDQDFQFIAIRGLLKTLDPHSVFLDQDLWEDQQTQTKGTFGGVGVVIGIRKGQLTVIAPLEGTPASRAGIKAEDVIVRIEDVSTINMALHEAVNLMRGPKGKPVSISVMREGLSEAKDYKIVRDIIKTKTVEHQPLEAGIHYIRVKGFPKKTAEDIRKPLDAVIAKGEKINGLILDLRNNPGGLLDEAMAVSDLFVNKGSIFSTVDRINKEGRREYAHKGDTFDDFPLAILVNGGSASASEIVSGAVKYLNRGVVIGQQTFGKGSVQMLYTLPKKTALKLTVEKYLTSNDSSIQNVGISPDIALYPARVNDKKVSVFSSAFRRGEKDLEGHVNTRGLKENVDRPVYSMRYLSENDEDDYASMYSKKDATKDYEIQFATRLLKASKYRRRNKQLRDLRLFINEERMRERKKLTAALGKRQIAWSTEEKKRKKKCTAPEFSVQIGKKNTVKAGEKVKIKVNVSNSSNCTLNNFWAMSKSEDYFLDRKEFVFGNVAPKEKKSFEIEATVPDYAPSRLANVQLDFYEEDEDAGLSTRKIFNIIEVKQPRFSYVYRLEDKPIKEGAGHNADGLAQKDESIRLHLRIKNVGSGTSKDNIATLKNLSGSGIYLKSGRAKLGELKPGGYNDVSFDFDVRPYYEKESFEVELQIYDNQFAKFVRQKIAIPLNHQPPAGKPEKRNDVLRVIPGTTARVYNGASLNSPVIAKLEPGRGIRVTSRWGGFYGVALNDKAGACKTGWIRTGALAISNKAPDKKLKSVRCEMREPPRVVVHKSVETNKVATSKFLSLKGNLKDDRAVKDMYILVNNEKVFYQAFQKRTDGKKKPKSLKSAEFEAILHLEKGTNRITIVARDEEDFFDQHRMVILYKPEEAKVGRKLSRNF